MKKVIIIIMYILFGILMTACDASTSEEPTTIEQTTELPTTKTTTMMSYELDEYDVNDYSDASMVISDESITSKGLLLELNYYGEDEGTTGAWFTIFHFKDNDWNELSYIRDGEVNWTMIAYIVEKNQGSQISTNWEWLYGELSTGRYLIVKRFINHLGPGDYDEYYLACEFTI
ncbi:MAG: hypothetical protein PF513_00525 [Tenericutes bacterium]|nr:hypothetical protein [Mycoplasmatota bacterium]